MKKINNTLIFTFVTLVLLIIPLSRWVKYLDVLATGVTVEYEINGYDPVDVFKGNYVAISYDSDDYAFCAYLDDVDEAYIVFDGNGNVVKITEEKPKEKCYMKAEVWSSWYDDDDKIYGVKTDDNSAKRLYVDWPEKFYTDAETAKRIEDELQGRVNNEEESRYKVILKIKKGVALIVGLEKIG